MKCSKKSLELINCDHWVGWYCKHCTITIDNNHDDDDNSVHDNSHTFSVPAMNSQSIRKLTFDMMNVDNCLCCKTLFCIPLGNSYYDDPTIVSWCKQCYICGYVLVNDEDHHHDCVRSTSSSLSNYSYNFDNCKAGIVISRRGLIDGILGKCSSVKKPKNMLCNNNSNNYYENTMLYKLYTARLKCKQWSECDDCVVCMDNHNFIISTPCYHKVMCRGCAKKCKTCPMCRSVIDDIIMDPAATMATLQTKKRKR
ncbi:iap-like protein [Trichoplusia ni ascovirus 6b]|nr:iap-like protein [Trichoplusia ni ascovirus 6b]